MVVPRRKSKAKSARYNFARSGLGKGPQPLCALATFASAGVSSVQRGRSARDGGECGQSVSGLMGVRWQAEGERAKWGRGRRKKGWFRFGISTGLRPGGACKRASVGWLKLWRVFPTHGRFPRLSRNVAQPYGFVGPGGWTKMCYSGSSVRGDLGCRESGRLLQ